MVEEITDEKNGWPANSRMEGGWQARRASGSTEESSEGAGTRLSRLGWRVKEIRSLAGIKVTWAYRAGF